MNAHDTTHAIRLLRRMEKDERFYQKRGMKTEAANERASHAKIISILKKQ